MNQEEQDLLKEVLAALDDLADFVQYYCIGIYVVKDSFLEESLQRARKVSSKAKELQKP